MTFPDLFTIVVILVTALLSAAVAVLLADRRAYRAVWHDAMRHANPMQPAERAILGANQNESQLPNRPRTAPAIAGIRVRRPADRSADPRQT